MSQGNKWVEQHVVGNPERGLIVEIHKGLDPYLAIANDDGGWTVINLDQVHSLVEVLSQAAADLAAEIIGEQGDILVHCSGCSRLMHVTVLGPDYYCEACEAGRKS